MAVTIILGGIGYGMVGNYRVTRDRTEIQAVVNEVYFIQRRLLAEAPARDPDAFAEGDVAPRFRIGAIPELPDGSALEFSYPPQATFRGQVIRPTGLMRQAAGN